MSDVYGTIDGANAYHAARGNTAWAAKTDPEKQAALQVSSEYIDGKFGSLFPGTKVGQRSQIREWPRYSAVDVYGYPIDDSQPPREIETATYEAALREAVTPGSLSTDFTLATNIKQVAISGAVSVTYAGAGSVEDAQLVMPVLQRILWPILTAYEANLSSLSGAGVRV